MRLAVLAAAAVLAGCNMNYSDGVRSGIVQKISHKGLICKTYEGELVLDGFKSRAKGSSQTVTNVWAFSAEDPKVVAELEKASEVGYRVKLTYTGVAFKAPCKGDTRYTVTKVEKAAE